MLYWFAWQQQTSTSRPKNFDLFILKFSSIFNELSFKFQKQLEVIKKWLKLKHSTKPHTCGIQGLSFNRQIKFHWADMKNGPFAIF